MKRLIQLLIILFSFSVITENVFAQNYWEINGNNCSNVKNRIGTKNNTNFVFKTSDSDRMILTNTGDLGIGTLSPTKLLDVNGQIRLRYNPVNNGVLISDNEGNATWGLLSLNLNNNLLGIQNQGSTVDLTPYLDNTDSQTLSLTGNNLSISGGNNVLFTGWDTDVSDDFSGNYNDLSNLPTLFDGNWTSLQGTPPSISTFNNDAGYVTSADDADADPNNEIQNLSLNNDGLGISGGNTITLDGINYWSKLNENLYYGNGNVGIGISEPNQLLHLHSNKSVLPVADIGHAVPNISIKSSNVHSINRSYASSILLTNKNSGSSSSDGLLIRSSNNNALIYLQEEGTLTLKTKNKLYFKMRQNGKVSIGKENNDYFTINENGNGNSRVKKNLIVNGKVGIGTSTPNAKLEIKGSLSNANYLLGLEQGYGIYSDNLGSGGSSSGSSRLWINAPDNGSIVFGPRASAYKLNNIRIRANKSKFEGHIDVKGTGRFYKVRVTTTGWSDFVFDDDYNLMPLSELADFIKQNKHLPGIPNEQEVLKDGIDVGEMNKKLLEKIEQLTLHIIEQEKRIKALESKNKD